MVLIGCVLCSGCAIGFAGSPTAVSVNGAGIAGKVVSNEGGATEFWLEYGKTDSLGSASAHQSVSTQANTPASVFVELSGLERDTAYRYRLCAEDSEAGACGAARGFRTQDVACGETVTADVKLTGNLNCGVDSPGPIAGPNGIVVGADGLDINLAGYSVTGPVFLGGDSVKGVDDSGGFDDLTIRNGTLGGWGRAIALSGANRTQVRGVSAEGSPYGLEVTGGSGTEVRSSRLFGRSTGLLVIGHDGLVVAGGEIEASFGPVAEIEAGNSLVSRNELSAGIPTTALRVTGSGNRLVGNRFGALVGTGINVLSGSGNVVIDNEVSEAILIDPTSPGGSGGDGIFIGPLAAGTLLRDNYVHDNEGDGIEVQSADTRLRGNRADANDDLGIQAVTGVTDLGGNSASGNGNPLQCTNVFCQ